MPAANFSQCCIEWAIGAGFVALKKLSPSWQLRTDTHWKASWVEEGVLTLRAASFVVCAAIKSSIAAKRFLFFFFYNCKQIYYCDKFEDTLHAHKLLQLVEAVRRSWLHRDIELWRVNILDNEWLQQMRFIADLFLYFCFN